jgi:Chitin synthase export chaperone
VCFVAFSISFFIAISTVKDFAGMIYLKPTGLWIIYFIWPILCVVVYMVLQLMQVVQMLDDWWPIGDIMFGVAFLAVVQEILFAFSNLICDSVKHYINGLFLF